MKKLILVLFVLMSMGMMASAASLTVGAYDATLYQAGSHDLTFTAVRLKNTTVVNCTLFDDVDGSWGRDISVAVKTSVINGTNTFTINPSWPSVGTANLWNVKCVSNYTKTYKHGMNATITFFVYKTTYNTTDLGNLVVDAFGTGLVSGLSWVDLLVLLVIVSIIVAMVARFRR